MKIYLDIDGTLILNEGFSSTPANYLYEFLTNAVDKHEVFWLTTHCNGDKEDAINYIKRFVPKTFIPLLEKIYPTSWNISKSEAIDMNSDFLWFDDVLMFSDEEILRRYNKLNCFVRVDLNTKPNFLLDYLAI